MTQFDNGVHVFSDGLWVKVAYIKIIHDDVQTINVGNDC